MCPLFVCQRCQKIENTALSPTFWQGFHQNKNELKICFECITGREHKRFKKEKFDPKIWEYETKDFVTRQPKDNK